MYKKIASASHQFRKRTFTRRNTSINHRNIVIEPKKVSQLVLSPHHPHGSLTPRQKSLFLHSRIMVQHVCNNAKQASSNDSPRKNGGQVVAGGVEKSG